MPFVVLLVLLPRLLVVGGRRWLGGAGGRGVADDLIHLLVPGPMADRGGAGNALALHLVALLEVVDLVLTLLHALAPAALALAVGHGGGDVLPVPAPEVPSVELLEPVGVGVEEAADGAVRPLLPVLAVVGGAASALPPPAAADVGAVLAAPIAELLGAVPPALGVVRRLPAVGAVVALLLGRREGGGAGARAGRGVDEAEGLGLLRRRGRLGGGRLGSGVGIVTEEAEVVVARGHGMALEAALGLRRGLRSRPRRRR